MNRYEKHSLAGNWKIKPFLSYKMAQKQFSSSPQSSETKPNTKLVLGSRKPLFNKPNKQNVYEIDSFNKFNFFPSQKNPDTLIDVRNAKHQIITS